jgi:hypothetical protein
MARTVKPKTTTKAPKTTAKVPPKPKATKATKATKPSKAAKPKATTPTKAAHPAFTLANVRDPLRGKPTAADKKQLAVVLEAEGLGSAAEAREDDEVSFQLVDVLEGNVARFQLLVWPFGSAALFAAGKPRVVGGAEQHAFHLDEGDAAVYAALADAYKAFAKKLGLHERLTFRTPPEATAAPKATKGSKADAPASFEARLAEIRALAAAGSRAQVSRACDALGVFPSWKVYPKRHPDELTKEERAFAELLLDLDLPVDLQSSGLFDRDAHLARFLGREKPGPSDERVHVGGRSVPVWWAVASVGSGHVERDDVLRAWKALPAAKALAAWKEIATGEAYDVLDAHATSMKDAGISGKPYMKDYRTRVAGLLADASVALGAEGEKAAKEITKKLPSWGGGAQILIGLLSAARHAKARGAIIDPAFDATFERLWERVGPDSFYAPAVEAEIEGALPPPRAKAFRAGLTQPT